MRAEFVYQPVYSLVDVAFFHLAIVRNDKVKNQIGVRRPLHHAEIVDRKAGINAPYNLRELQPQAVDLLVLHHDRIHVDHHIHVEFFLDFAFNQVNGVMAFHNIRIGGNFRVCGGKDAVWPVVVNDQVMHADHAFKGKNLRFQCLNELWVGRLAEEIAHGVAHDLNAGIEDEKGDDDAHIAVEWEGGKFGEDQREHGNRRCRRIADAVHHHCAYGRGINPLTKLMVE